MLSSAQSESLARLRVAREFLRAIEESESRNLMSAITRTMKGLMFVQIYGIYEFVVKESVEALIRAINTLEIPMEDAHTELLALALNPEIQAIINGAVHKTWDNRIIMLRKIRSREMAIIPEGSMPSDGSNYKPRQLQTIWNIFGIAAPILPEERLRGRINEIVENRNRIAHGSDSAEGVGQRYTTAELAATIDDVESIITYILTTVASYSVKTEAFRRVGLRGS